MPTAKRHSGFSLMEVLVAATIFAIWLPSSLYALQVGLATQLKVQRRAELVESMMALHVDIAKQWRQGVVSVQEDEIYWELDVLDEHRAILHLSASAYELNFVLIR